MTTRSWTRNYSGDEGELPEQMKAEMPRCFNDCERPVDSIMGRAISKFCCIVCSIDDHRHTTACDQAAGLPVPLERE
jgi:hypothetical protein